MTQEILLPGSTPPSSSSRDEATQAVRQQKKVHRLEKTDPQGRKPKLPTAGEELFGFRLRCELGRGAYACVFLAEQAELAGRPVVLKVSDLEGDEPQTLAQ